MKINALFLLLFLTACHQLGLTNYLNGFLGNTISTNIYNKNCINIAKFKIFQVFDDNYALARSCEDNDDTLCLGLVVLLTPQENIDYYDEMYILAPDNKCPVQDGVYRYTTKNDIKKTVPIIYFEDKILDSDDKISTIDKYNDYDLEAFENSCISSLDNKTAENIKVCKCMANFLKNDLLNITLKELYEIDEESVGEYIFTKMQNKCGTIK